MKKIRGPDHYRAEAAHFLELAAAADDARLRDSYLSLCIQYERLADVLEYSPREGCNAPPAEPVEPPKTWVNSSVGQRR